MDFSREIAKLSEFNPAALAGGGMASALDPNAERRDAARRLITACSPSTALAKHWLAMPVIEVLEETGRDKRAAFPHLLAAVTAVLADPAGIEIMVRRSYPAATITMLGAEPRRFGYQCAEHARASGFDVPDVAIDVTITSALLVRIADTIRSGLSRAPARR